MAVHIRSRVIRCLAVVAVIVGAFSQDVPWRLLVSAAAQEPLAGVARMSDGAGPAAGAAVGNMTYHGGPVQHVQKVFTVFWIPGSAFPAGYQTTINQFVQDLNGSPFYAINSQYGDGSANISRTVLFGGTWLDTVNAFPNTALSYADLLDEVNRAKAANGWTSDANSYFQVYTPAGITSAAGGGICGLHWFANPAIGQILFPQPGCFPGAPYPNGSTVDAAINTSSHEIFEAVTDPLGNAWYFQNVSGENGDLCNFTFGPRAANGSNTFLNGRPYLVQQEWSNAASGCVLPPSLSITANGSSGTLTLPPHGALQIAIAADSGTPGFANPSDLYIGLSTPQGVLFLGNSGFTPAVTALYHGPLAIFGPAALFNIPDSSVLAPGTYVWFILVNGPTGTFFDTVETTITP
jgi:hypothetical protein